MAKKSGNVLRRGVQLLLLGLIVSCAIVYVAYMIDAESLNVYGDYIVWNSDAMAQQLDTDTLRKTLNQTRQQMDYMKEILDKQTATNQQARKTIKSLQKKIGLNIPKISSLQDQLNKAKTAKDRIQSKLQNKTQLISTLQDKLDKAKGEKEGIQSKLQNETQIVSKLNDKLDKAKEVKERLQNVLNNKTETITAMQSEMDKISKQMKEASEPKSVRYNSDYMRSYNYWISGIADHVMKTNSHCPNPLKTETLSKDMLIEPDVLHNGAENECHSRTFSELFGQTLIIECSVDDKPKIAEFADLFHSNPLKIGGSAFKLLKNSTKDQSVFVYKIKKKIQMIWTKCGDLYNMHLSVQSLAEQNVEKLQYKQKRIQTRFQHQKPPNIIIFVIESMSRSLFMRSNPMSVDYLSHLMLHPKSKTNIFQFFRYSTIGYGLESNLAALIGGKCIEENCKETENENCADLASFFDELGYFVPGYIDNDDDDEEDKKCDFSLSFGGFSSSDCTANKFDIEYAVQFALNLDKEFKDLQVPYFTILRVKNNGFGVNDKYIRELVENVDQTNTILHIVSANGDYGALNIYGHYESNNPISILMMPQNLSVNVEKLRKNEQRLVNHYDFNLFFKELAVSFLSDEYKEKYQQMIKDNLPTISISDDDDDEDNDKLFVFGQSILTEIISEERSCENIDLSYCFCDGMRQKEISQNNEEKMQKNVQNMINRINFLAKREKYECEQLDANDFQIGLVLFNEDYERMYIEETMQSLGIKRIKKWKQWKAEGKILTYSADIMPGKTLKHTPSVQNLVKMNTFVDGSCMEDDDTDNMNNIKLCNRCLSRNNL